MSNAAGVDQEPSYEVILLDIIFSLDHLDFRLTSVPAQGTLIANGYTVKIADILYRCIVILA